MKKTLYAIALLIGCAPAANADGNGKVTWILSDDRPCVFFQTNGGYSWYALPSDNSAGINSINKDTQASSLYMSFNGLGNISFWLGGRFACGLPYSEGIGLTP